MTVVIYAARRELDCRSCHRSRIHPNSIRHSDSVWAVVPPSIRLLGAMVLSNVAVRVFVLELVREQVELHAERQEPVVLLLRLAFWPAEDLASLSAVEVPVPEQQVVAEVERVPGGQRQAVRRSVDRRA